MNRAAKGAGCSREREKCPKGNERHPCVGRNPEGTGGRRYTPPSGGGRGRAAVACHVPRYGDGTPSPSQSARGRGAQRTQGIPAQAGNLKPSPTQLLNHYAIRHTVTPAQVGIQKDGIEATIVVASIPISPAPSGCFRGRRASIVWRPFGAT